MTLVHSLEASDITSDQSGPRLLRDYLDYTSNPVDFFARRVEDDGLEEPESPFEEAVVAALRRAGYEVTPQVGIAGYRVDIGIRSDGPSKYILGVECDGFTYHRSPAARDRDWLRQSVLEDLGWTIHRVWSTAWVRNPRAELRKIEGAIEAAKRRVEQPPEFNADLSEPIEDEKSDDIEPIQEASAGFRTYEYAALGELAVRTDLELQSVDFLVLGDLIRRVVEVEMPIRADQVAERIRAHWGLKRTGSLIWERIKAAISYAMRNGIVAWDESTKAGRIDQRFLVIQGRPVEPRRPADDDEPRKIELISETEVAKGLLPVIDWIHGGTRDDVVLQTSREFGYQRTGDKIDSRLNRVLDQLVRSGLVQETQGVMIRAKAP